MSKRKGRQQNGAWRTPQFRWAMIGLSVGLLLILFGLVRFESYASLYDAEYVGSAKCGECHTVIYQEWLQSPHSKMTRRANAASIVGNFSDGEYHIPEQYATPSDDGVPAAKMYEANGQHIMALRNPGEDTYTEFPIEYTIGFQYRQTYLTREANGVLRRLPLQWSVERGEYFSYWNYQEGSEISVEDLWAQMGSLNSAWNLFCARCHTTNLDILDKNPSHTYAVTEWTDNGIACEACHGAGSQHVNYFDHNYVNRIAAFANSKVRNQPVAYIAVATKLDKGEKTSVCARCHGSDIMMSNTDIYRIYEPGYSEEGRINDLSDYFQSVPVEARDFPPTVEVYADNTHKGIGMLFRSFVDSACYINADVSCNDCHQPHNNKAPTEPGILEPSQASNNYCLQCHEDLRDEVADHSKHEVGTAGSYCMDCHMPQRIVNIVAGTERLTRTHEMSHIPSPENSLTYGIADSPNACTDCHSDQTVEWAAEYTADWWGQP